jgi:hypothetical protein
LTNEDRSFVRRRIKSHVFVLVTIKSLIIEDVIEDVIILSITAVCSLHDTVSDGFGPFNIRMLIGLSSPRLCGAQSIELSP